uniref:PCI domain-containing protein n=1 Tax=Hyaloperonospora arabidopsidis (strain Emoy2) TaxID=559515 RepID=M4BBF3_HYAAE
MLSALEEKAQVLRAAVESSHIDEATALLAQLKIALTTLPALSLCDTGSSTAQQELELAHMTAYERSVLQLKVYYSSGLHPSALHYPILGTRLLQLLVENRMAEFHNELELLPEPSREDPNVAFAIKLEQYLMEGTYNKVLEARTHVPNPYFAFFLSQLLQTVRENIADCAEVAYQCLTLADAQKMLIFDSAAELGAYIQDEKTEWVVREGRVWFKAPEKSLSASDIPSLKLVGETLAYATELDRIV